MTATLAPAAMQSMAGRDVPLLLAAKQVQEGDVITLPGSGRQVDVLDTASVSETSRRIVLAAADTLTVPADMRIEVVSAIRGYEIPCLLCTRLVLAVIDIGDCMPDATVICKACDDTATAEVSNPDATRETRQ